MARVEKIQREHAAMIELVPSVVSVRLSKGMETLIDSADSERVNKFKWSVSTNSHSLTPKYYAMRRISYAKSNDKGPRFIYLHRYLTDCPKGKCVDHINGNSLDNRQENLRITTVNRNNQNRRAPRV